MSEGYQRFQVGRPDYLGDEHWRSVETEVTRLDRSLTAGDRVQGVGDLKCLVEAVAKVTLEIAGTPADPNASFDSTVHKAHTLLAQQPGHELANESEFGKMATQASKIARSLANIRNEFGGGHGRARQPAVKPEMVDMALDGALLWVRWALRRVGLFSEGRPDALIRDLIEEGAVFHAGVLRRRLEAANLPHLEQRHQRALGVAVGQRAMQGTFVVAQGGVTACVDSDDTETLWTPDYRLGLANGLLFDPAELPTVTDRSVRDGLMALDPLPDCTEELTGLVNRIVGSTREGTVATEDPGGLREFVMERANVRPETERPALERLATHISAWPF
ncbi:hypothetical protein ACFVTZ_03635 [Cellulosimicrobium cellulans]|uniref:hypothetical protein n=1 Tax=Cellulosimicrobium cellulans TaxID=1710 RepID=UPI0036E03E72